MSKFAIALDIGTTNISAALIDIDKKRIIASLDRPNEQVIYGDDVISRLKFAFTKNGIKELNRKVIDSINSIIALLISQSGVKTEAVFMILAVGNVAMYHLTLCFPVDTLARAPFLPLKTALVRKKAKALGLKGLANAEFIFLPNIGGFVGSDAIGVILALDMHKQEDIRLAVDLGTNGEVILGNSKKILVASTAAGPAFEGWHISCGTRSIPGAIISFGMKKDKVSLKTVGNLAPTGIASSGLIQIMSTLIEGGYIDKTGRLASEIFTVYQDGKREIFLNQKDVREIQLAKSAIQTAVELLKTNYGIGYKDVEEVIVTGRFGGSLNKEDLINIGILPVGLKEKNFRFVENLALKGTGLILTEDRMDEVDSILRIVKHIELHRDKAFQEEFARALHFGG